MIDIQPVLAGDRLALSRLLTAVENDTPDGRRALSELFAHTGRGHLIGVTGAPGTGKSSLVNRLARHYRGLPEGEQPSVAIVAVDPSSPFTGGAVLGDRIRMVELSGDPGVFVRSMASRGSLGGLARTTAGLVQVFDAAGYEIIMVETVGAGQAEVDIARLADTTVVVAEPDPLVDVDRGGVVGLDVQHAHVEAGAGEVVEPGPSEAPPDAAAVVGRVDADHVDLAHRRRRVGVDLGPAEPDQLVVDLVDEQTGAVEPRLAHLPVELGAGESALFGVPAERTVVDGDEGVGVARLERADRQVARLGRELDPHLPQVAVGHEAAAARNLVGLRPRGVVEPLNPELEGSTAPPDSQPDGLFEGVVGGLAPVGQALPDDCPVEPTGSGLDGRRHHRRLGRSGACGAGRGGSAVRSARRARVGSE